MLTRHHSNAKFMQPRYKALLQYNAECFSGRVMFPQYVSRTSQFMISFFTMAVCLDPVSPGSIICLYHFNNNADQWQIQHIPPPPPPPHIHTQKKKCHHVACIIVCGIFCQNPHIFPIYCWARSQRSERKHVTCRDHFMYASSQWETRFYNVTSLTDWAHTMIHRMIPVHVQCWLRLCSVVDRKWA